MEVRLGLIKRVIMDFGKIMSLMEKANSSILQGIIMKVNGRILRHMGRESILEFVEKSTQGLGWMIGLRELEWRYPNKEMCTKVISKRV